MLMAVMTVWCIVVFGAYGYCVVSQTEPLFYLWAAFAAIGAVFLIMDSAAAIRGANRNANRPENASFHAKEEIRDRRKSAQNFTPFSSLLAYMTIPLILCILCEYLIF